MYRTGNQYCRICIIGFVLILFCFSAVEICAEQAPVQNKRKAPATARQRLRTRVTYSCTNSPIDTVLKDLAEQANIYIVKSPEVTGDVTVEVVGVPLEEVLGNVLAAHKYTYIATENMIRVVPLSETVILKETLLTRVYKITYANATEVALALKEFLSTNGRVAVNKGTSHLIVTDTENKIKGIDKFIEEIDRITGQVLVEVRIYDITSDEKFQIETAWDISRNAPEIITQHTNTSSARSGWDFADLVNILPRETTAGTTTTTGDMATTTTTGDVTQETINPDVTTTTTDNDRTTTTTNWIPDPGPPPGWVGTQQTTEVDTGSETELVGAHTITETTTAGPVVETITTGPVTETETTVSGIQDFDTYYDTYRDNTVNRSTTTKSYLTRRRKPVIGGSFSPATGGTLRFSLLNSAIDLEFALSLLHSQVEAKLLANPRILVLDNETANFEIVREIPYRELQQVARADPITYTAFKNVGVQLKVTPHIARDGIIRLQIAPEFGVLVGLDAQGLPTVDTRRADTTTLIEDGQTVVLGGLRRKELTTGVDKVPLLGDMPLIGGLFRAESEKEQTKELVVFITTNIITKPLLTQDEQIRLNEIDLLLRKAARAKVGRNNQSQIEPKPLAPPAPQAIEIKPAPPVQTKPRNNSAKVKPADAEGYIDKWMNRARKDN